MFQLYSFLYTIVFILMSPILWLKGDKYAAGFKQRLGDIPNFYNQDGRPVIWIHCVSVGETNAARPLIDKILKLYPNYRLVLTTTTKTGQELARKLYADRADLIFYFPFDWQWTVRKVLENINPNVILIMETELWFNFLREAHRKGARVFIINGRLSEKSVKGYLRAKKTVKRVMRYIDVALMQTVEDANRLLQLGIQKNKVKITGNFKFDQKPDEKEDILTVYFQERFNFSENSPLIVAASTHEPEEKWILEAFKNVYKSNITNLPRLVIAPRHPERFAAVEKLVEETGFSWVKRTSTVGFEDELADVILLDSVGELRAMYPLAEIVFIGGSLIPHGGQNFLEAVRHKKAVIAGHYMTNFQAMTKDFVKENALLQLPKLSNDEIPKVLTETFQKLLTDDETKDELAENALTLMKKNRGATNKTLEYLQPYLQVQSNVVKN